MGLRSFLGDVGSFFTLLNPYRAEDFFAGLEPRSLGQMFGFLAVMGVPLFVGYFIHHLLKPGFGELECTFSASIESAFLAYAALLFLPFVAGFVLSLFGRGLAGREIDVKEIVAIIAYPVSVILVSGIFKAHVFTILLHYILIGYGVYLLYVAVSSRFGLARALESFMLFLFVSAIVFMVMFWFGLTLVSVFIGFFEFLGYSREDIILRDIPSYCF